MKPEEIVEFIKNKKLQHRCFYHFTDHRNVESIKNHGLYAKKFHEKIGLSNVITGGNEWSLGADARSGMDSFVHLCFLNQHPMCYQAVKDKRIENPVFLRIDPEVILISGSQFTNAVANKSGVTGVPISEAPDGYIDFEVIYTKTDWKNPEIQERLKAAKKCEILIPSHIPAKYISVPNG
ncbi:DarT ssDNA thymidine ADP-ribosyltransferase family protein [Niveispirillum sp. BGYR6]|uniref:DarT ssDNA thymidine ADP-ribosyltransferase family protein n=1 Tax=Niveispirillum sp. BGYR6 TaxID=2971249 RepID=UPI0022B98260|nr:DarT ssDNA thymidine ADP-ribosyltransferase family protein [Niveispirillum sp. BGYR6]MDG5494913.1 DarT ssDNA thymidine ADP-ribosyltransferase family protein [Niveispirillum sp. BGYR6]